MAIRGQFSLSCVQAFGPMSGWRGGVVKLWTRGFSVGPLAVIESPMVTTSFPFAGLVGGVGSWLWNSSGVGGDCWGFVAGGCWVRRGR